MTDQATILRDLQQGKGYAVGSLPVEQRKSTKFVATMIRVGLVVGAFAVASHFLKDDAGAQMIKPIDMSVSQSMQDSAQQAVDASTGQDSVIPVMEEIEISVPTNIQEQQTWKVLSDLEPEDETTRKYPLDIEVTPKDTHSSLVMKLYKKGNLFQAATIQAEGLKTTPYYIEGDSTQPTIGVGYNVKMSVGAIGRAGVRKELTTAGISPNNVDMLMSPSQSVSSQARITPHQALALLDIASDRFERSTRSAIGAGTYDKLPKHRQAALMMIDYNSNIHKRQSIISAVRQGNTIDAIENMDTSGVVNGKRQRLANSALPQTMYFSAEGARKAIMQPETIKRQVTSGITMWGGVDKEMTQVADAQSTKTTPIDSAQMDASLKNALASAQRVPLPNGMSDRLSDQPINRAGGNDQMAQGSMEESSVEVSSKPISLNRLREARDAMRKRLQSPPQQPTIEQPIQNEGETQAPSWLNNANNVQSGNAPSAPRRR